MDNLALEGAGAASGAIQDHSILSMVTGSGPVVQTVLIILIFLSVWSWAITIAKLMQFRKSRHDSDEFNAIFWETKNFARVDDSSRRLSSSPLARVFANGYRELTHILHEHKEGNVKRSSEFEMNIIEHALKRSTQDELMKLQKGVTFLASVASAAPFIGLFGTVWGIMNAFHGLSSAKSTSIQAVAPGISEALVATAIGLAAAIPASIAYNYFVVAIKNFRQSLDAFCQEFLDISRQYFNR